MRTCCNTDRKHGSATCCNSKVGSGRRSPCSSCAECSSFCRPAAGCRARSASCALEEQRMSTSQGRGAARRICAESRAADGLGASTCNQPRQRTLNARPSTHAPRRRRIVDSRLDFRKLGAVHAIQILTVLLLNDVDPLGADSHGRKPSMQRLQAEVRFVGFAQNTGQTATSQSLSRSQNSCGYTLPSTNCDCEQPTRQTECRSLATLVRGCVFLV